MTALAECVTMIVGHSVFLNRPQPERTFSDMYTSRFFMRAAIIAAFLIALTLSTVALAGRAMKSKRALENQTSPSASVQVLDLLWLKPGVEPQAAGDYFNNLLGPIARKHGGRAVFTYRVVNVMRGDIKPAVINSFEFPSMGALQELLNDPEYQKIVPQRDAIFDLSEHRLFQVAPISGK